MPPRSPMSESGASRPASTLDGSNVRLSASGRFALLLLAAEKRRTLIISQLELWRPTPLPTARFGPAPSPGDRINDHRSGLRPWAVAIAWPGIRGWCNYGRCAGRGNLSRRAVAAPRDAIVGARSAIVGTRSVDTRANDPTGANGRSGDDCTAANRSTGLPTRHAGDTHGRQRIADPRIRLCHRTGLLGRRQIVVDEQAEHSSGSRKREPQNFDCLIHGDFLRIWSAELTQPPVDPPTRNGDAILRLGV